MFSFNSLKDFITALNREKEVINTLFERRNVTIRVDDLLNLVDNEYERLERLARQSIITRNGDIIELEERLLEFLEEFLEVNEVIHNAYVSEYIEVLKSNITYFFAENLPSKRERYTRKIKSDLRKIGKTIIVNINTLRRNTDEVYKTETNFEIKKDKLENYRDKRDNIENLIKQIEIILDDKFFLTNTTDEELSRILINLKVDLKEAKNNLLEIQQHIIDYLNQIKVQSEVFKKLQRIKHLKDQFELEQKSDIAELMQRNNSLFLQLRMGFSTWLSLDQLQTDFALKVIKNVNKRMETRPTRAEKLAGPISEEYFNESEKEEHLINIESIKNTFISLKGDLFTFIINHPFQINRKMELSERITLFCKIASLYYEELDITGEYGRHKNVEYAVIRAKT